MMTKTMRSADDALNEAVALWRAGSLDAAERLAQHVVKTYPKFGNGHALLGEIAASRGDFDRAVTEHQRAIRLDPKSARFHCYLATALSGLGRFRDAITQYERALKIRANDPMATGGLAHVLSMRGKYDEASSLIQPFLDKGTATTRMHSVHARRLFSQRRDDEVVSFVRAHDADGLDVAPHRDMLVTLGRSLERLGRFDEAFEAFTRSNACARAEFDPKLVEARFAALKETFTPEAVAASPRATNTSELPVFIVGMPRSGSTLVEQIIHAHPHGYGAGEIVDLNHALAAMYLAHVNSDDPDAEPEAIQMDAIADGYLRALRRYGRNAHRIVDKHLGNFQHLGIMSVLFPNARIIHTKRHPMDTGLSCFKHPLIASMHPWSTSLEWTGAYYRAYHDLMAHWTNTLKIDVLDVQYEELVAEPETHARRIIDFCGLDWDDACLRFHDVRRDVTTISFDQVTQPMYTSAVDLWKNYEKQLEPLCAALGPLADVS
jgi:tetratricopeptide (TPR) repeat protein